MRCPRPIREHELSMEINNIQLLVFEETNIKIYWCMKGDVDRREIIVLFLFCDKRLVDIGIED